MEHPLYALQTRAAVNKTYIEVRENLVADLIGRCLVPTMFSREDLERRAQAILQLKRIFNADAHSL